jgi:hypothetical protein
MERSEDNEKVERLCVGTSCIPTIPIRPIDAKGMESLSSKIKRMGGVDFGNLEG